jgi:hypothetical protein
VASDRPSVVDGLDVNEATDGLIVYQPNRDRVHYLNETAAAVFTLCDGSQDTADIAALLANAYGLDEAPSHEVEECLAQLRNEGLVR